MKTRTLEKLREVLKDPNAVGPRDVYHMFRGQPNITVLVPGKIGEEFTKTYGHYHKHGEQEVYEILHGTGLLLTQRRGAEDAQLEDITVREIKTGSRVEIPTGFGHLLINTGNTFLVTEDNAPTDAETSQNDYEPIEKLGGFGYYIVDDGKGAWKAVQNESYTKVPKLVVAK